MLISEHIMRLQKILEDHGDQDLYMWVDEDGQHFLYPVRVPEIEVSVIGPPAFLRYSTFSPELRDCNGNILIVTNLDTTSFDREQDDVQNLELEII